MASKATRNYSPPAEFGKRAVDRATAFKLAVRNVGRLQNLTDSSGTLGFIGFTTREMKRGDVAALIGGQQTRQMCPGSLPFQLTARTWFRIGREITDAEWRKFLKRHQNA
jgi:hypothetical protein